MKCFLPLLVLLLLSSACSNEISNHQNFLIKLDSYKWKLLGFTDDGEEGFYNQNRLENVFNGRDIVNSTDILITFDKPKQMKNLDETIEVSSAIVSVIIDCDSDSGGVVMPIDTYFYKNKNPAVDEKSILSWAYDDSEGIFLERHSDAFRNLCSIPA